MRSFYLFLILLLTLPRLQAQQPTPEPTNREEQILAELREINKKRENLEAEYQRLTKRPPPTSIAEEPPKAPVVTTPAVTKPLSFKDRYGLKIRQSLKDKNLGENPGLLQYSQPSEGDDSYAIDMGISADLLKVFSLEKKLGDSMSAEGSVEYHYNSAIGSLQDTLITGINLQWYLGHTKGDDLDVDEEESSGIDFEHRINTNLGFKRDNTVSGEGALIELLYSPLSESLGLWSNHRIDSLDFEFALRPEVGLQFETGNGATAKFADGERLSVKAAMGVAIYPMSERLKKRVEWANTFVYWNHLHTHGGFNNFANDVTYFQSSLNLYFNDERNIGVGVDYIKGDNLTESKYNVDVWNLSFKVRF